ASSPWPRSCVHLNGERRNDRTATHPDSGRSGHRWSARPVLYHRLVVPGSGGEYGGMASVTVRRGDFGYFVRPAEAAGTGLPRLEPCLGYAVGHTDGNILYDNYMGSNLECDALYLTHRKGQQ